MDLVIFLGGKLSGVQRLIFLGTFPVPGRYRLDGTSKDTHLIFRPVFPIMRYEFFH